MAKPTPADPTPPPPSAPASAAPPDEGALRVNAPPVHLPQQQFLGASENRLRPPPQHPQGRGAFRLQEFTPAPPPEPQPEPPPAFIHDGEEEMSCRPPEGWPLHMLGECAIGHWVGRMGRKRVTVAHGTPLRGLPDQIVESMLSTREYRTGHIPPPPPPKGAGLPGHLPR